MADVTNEKLVEIIKGLLAADADLDFYCGLRRPNLKLL